MERKEFFSQQGEGRGQKESKELHPLPSVWDVLERDVRHWGREMENSRSGHDRELEKKYDREKNELERLENEIKEKGADRDRLILSLYYTTHINPRNPFGPSKPFWSRLTVEGWLKDFQRFRSWVEPLPDKKIAKAIEQEVNQMLKDSKSYRQRKK